MGGNTARVARDDLEKKLGESVITRNNDLGYRYIDGNDWSMIQKEIRIT